MKMRYKKKLYRKYTCWVRGDASISEYYRELMRKSEPYAIVPIDTEDPRIVSEKTASLCRRYGLRFRGYRTEFEKCEDNDKEDCRGCFFVFLPAEARMGDMFDEYSFSVNWFYRSGETEESSKG